MYKKFKQEPKINDSEWECTDTPRTRRQTLFNPAVKIKSQTDIEWFTTELPNAWEATSEDLYNDPEARLSDIYSQAHDTITMSTFQSSIFEHRHYIMNRTILIIGSGMLTLPLWAARAEAKQVYVIDKSKAIEYLQAVVVANKYENIIKLYNMSIEEVQLPSKHVDVIISNWMGFALLGDSKCSDIIYARDKWLYKSTGIIFPDKAELLVAGIECAEKKKENVDWWRNVHGFNMQAIRSLALKSAVQTKIEKREVMTAASCIWEIDLKTATLEDLHVDWNGFLEPNRLGQMEGLVIFFRVNFSKAHKYLAFTTSPAAPLTNWLQTVCYFNNPFKVYTEDPLKCELSMHSVEGFPLFENIHVKFKLHPEAPQKYEKTIAMNWVLSQMPNSATRMKTKDNTSQDRAFAIVKTEMKSE